MGSEFHTEIELPRIRQNRQTIALSRKDAHEANVYQIYRFLALSKEDCAVLRYTGEPRTQLYNTVCPCSY